MFRRVFASAPNLAKGFCGVGLAAAAVTAASSHAISDADLKKKPFWYQENVMRLEKALKMMSVYSYEDRAEPLDDAIDILRRCENVNNCEITWRLGRAIVEKAELLSARAFEDRTEAYVKAIDYFRKGMNIEPAKGCAGLHKWYAIVLRRFLDITSLHAYVKGARAEIEQHLERAVQLDPKDAIAWHLLGVNYYEKKKYEKAMEKFLKAEEIKKNFYPSNIYYMGMALSKMGKHEQAIATLTSIFPIHSHNKFDRKAKTMARAHLFLKYKMTNVRAYEEY